MSRFSELIKSFDKTRDYVRDFFIYGFKVRNEFNRKSSRTYDNEKRRVESWLGDFLRYDSTQRGKQIAISVDSGHIYENPLYKAYYSKSFTDNDIKLHFMLCDILSEDKGLNVRQITEILNEKYNEIFDEQTVRNKLKEYTNEGIFISEKQGKTDCFYLSPDTIEDFFEKYKGLDEAVKYFSESSEFGVIGNSLLKAADIKNSTFLRKHNYIVHTLEDEILLCISEFIKNKRLIKITNFSKNGYSSEKTGVPLKIYVSVQTGRRYLIMYTEQYQKFSSFRLDFIKSACDMGNCAEFDELLEKLNKDEKRCFGVSFGNKTDGNDEYGKIKIVLRADEKTEKYIIDRLEREKRCGKIEKTGDNLITYSAEIFDIQETMSWIKSFTGRIVSVEGTCTEVIQKFYDDISRMYSIYSETEDKNE